MYNTCFSCSACIDTMNERSTNHCFNLLSLGKFLLISISSSFRQTYRNDERDRASRNYSVYDNDNQQEHGYFRNQLHRIICGHILAESISSTAVSTAHVWDMRNGTFSPQATDNKNGPSRIIRTTVFHSLDILTF